MAKKFTPIFVLALLSILAIIGLASAQYYSNYNYQQSNGYQHSEGYQQMGYQQNSNQRVYVYPSSTYVSPPQVYTTTYTQPAYNTNQNNYQYNDTYFHQYIVGCYPGFSYTQYPQYIYNQPVYKPNYIYTPQPACGCGCSYYC